MSDVGVFSDDMVSLLDCASFVASQLREHAKIDFENLLKNGSTPQEASVHYVDDIISSSYVVNDSDLLQDEVPIPFLERLLSKFARISNPLQAFSRVFEELQLGPDTSSFLYPELFGRVGGRMPLFSSDMSERMIVQSTLQLATSLFTIVRDLNFLLILLVRVGVESLPRVARSSREVRGGGARRNGLTNEVIMTKLLPRCGQFVSSYFLVKWIALQPCVDTERCLVVALVFVLIV